MVEKASKTAMEANCLPVVLMYCIGDIQKYCTFCMYVVCFGGIKIKQCSCQ
jgi:hypothetical protein